MNQSGYSSPIGLLMYLMEIEPNYLFVIYNLIQISVISIPDRTVWRAGRVFYLVTGSSQGE